MLLRLSFIDHLKELYLLTNVHFFFIATIPKTIKSKPKSTALQRSSIPFFLKSIKSPYYTHDGNVIFYREAVATVMIITIIATCCAIINEVILLAMAAFISSL